MNPVTGAAAYFGLVFAAGFALGTLRELVLLRWLSQRAAELAEMPVMLIVSFLAARFVVGRLRTADLPRRLALGCVALGLLLAAEFLVVLRLRGLGLSEYLASRDPVAGTAYALSLLLFAFMPAIVGSGRRRSAGRESDPRGGSVSEP